MQRSGHLHPLTWTIRQSVAIFEKLGFQVVAGPEMETASYNFDRLNFPPNHPARDMQDTLWVDEPSDAGGDARLMRTHTSNVQIRALERFQPPVRLIVPGRVYRNERADATHAIDFFQLEGFVVDRNITMSHLLNTLESFAHAYFGPESTVRFRPSFFPFTEPSLEMSVNFRGQWLELVGAGMIHPNVITEMGLDSKDWSGFAFGFGVDRLMMIRYGIPNIRLGYSGDFRFLKQFPGGKQ
jgi:phenylalanyl-tRNA synthetase alpha chain